MASSDPDHHQNLRRSLDRFLNIDRNMGLRVGTERSEIDIFTTLEERNVGEKWH